MDLLELIVATTFAGISRLASAQERLILAFEYVVKCVREILNLVESGRGKRFGLDGEVAIRYGSPR